jgi:hypothetical protein
MSEGPRRLPWPAEVWVTWVARANSWTMGRAVLLTVSAEASIALMMFAATQNAKMLAMHACNLPGASTDMTRKGHCSPLPKGRTDDDLCPSGQLCDGAGACKDPGTTLALGKDCSKNEQCYNDACASPYCRLRVGDPCEDDVACVTNLCDRASSRCAACMNKSCPGEAACNSSTGKCAALPGQPCNREEDDDCKGNFCNNDYLCKLNNGEPCFSGPECDHGACELNSGGLATCIPCGGEGDCPGTKCGSSSTCLLPLRAYCVNQDQCDSGKCTGFPGKCSE